MQEEAKQVHKKNHLPKQCFECWSKRQNFQKIAT